MQELAQIIKSSNSCSSPFLNPTGGSSTMFDSPLRQDTTGSSGHTSILFNKASAASPVPYGGKGVRSGLMLLLQHSNVCRKADLLPKQPAAKRTVSVRGKATNIADIFVKSNRKGGCTGVFSFADRAQQ